MARCRVVALRGGESTDELRYPRALPWIGVAGKAQHGFEARTALRQVLPHVPKPEQSDAEAQRPLGIRRLKQPVQRGAKVVNLRIAFREPSRAIRGAQLRVAF